MTIYRTRHGDAFTPWREFMSLAILDATALGWEGFEVLLGRDR